MTSTINELRSKLEKYEINIISDDYKLKNKKLDAYDKEWLDERKGINYENSLIIQLARIDRKSEQLHDKFKNYEIEEEQKPITKPENENKEETISTTKEKK